MSVLDEPLPPAPTYPGVTSFGPGANLEDVARARKAWFKIAARQLRTIDTRVEAAQRRTRRVLDRKRGFPTEDDLGLMHNFGTDLQILLRRWAELLTQYPSFY